MDDRGARMTERAAPWYMYVQMDGFAAAGSCDWMVRGERREGGIRWANQACAIVACKPDRDERESTREREESSLARATVSQLPDLFGSTAPSVPGPHVREPWDFYLRALVTWVQNLCARISKVKTVCRRSDPARLLHMRLDTH
jgi:hypothetical protein